jgi:hypothetical protein
MLADLELGRSGLDAFDEGMAIVVGPFTPSPGYSAVEPFFRKLSDAMEARSVPAELYAERDALSLRVVGPDDVVVPTEFVTVHDFGKELGRELEVKLYDVAAWKRARRAGVSNREHPLQVSGDIVNTRPSGTKPR